MAGKNNNLLEGWTYDLWVQEVAIDRDSMTWEEWVEHGNLIGMLTLHEEEWAREDEEEIMAS